MPASICISERVGHGETCQSWRVFQRDRVKASRGNQHHWTHILWARGVFCALAHRAMSRTTADAPCQLFGKALGSSLVWAHRDKIKSIKCTCKEWDRLLSSILRRQTETQVTAGRLFRAKFVFAKPEETLKERFWRKQDSNRRACWNAEVWRRQIMLWLDSSYSGAHGHNLQ